jgi:two-component system, NarL family, response regulator DesR
VIRALRNGAIAYVLKRADPAHAVEAVRRAAAGLRHLSPGVAERGFDAYHEKAEAAPPDPHELLTPRERQALQLAAEGTPTRGSLPGCRSARGLPRCTGPTPCASWG